jgi:hypothetical protein
MDLPIKTLYFSDSISNFQIDIYKNKVEIYDLRSEIVNIKSHAEILSGSQVFCDLKTDYDIISYVILFTERATLDEDGKKTFDFYKYYENKQFPAFEIETQSGSTHKPRCFARFDGYGITHFQDNSDGLWKLSEQRISDFFFNGPKVPGLPLSVRMDLKRKIIFNVKDFNTTINHVGFWLLDYDKIPKKSYTENFNNIILETISLSKKGILIKNKNAALEWDCNYSFEDFRKNWAIIAGGWPEQTIAEINALIDGSAIENELMDKIIADTKHQEPGEAPPG